MSDNYNGWKKLDKIVIVYSADRTVKVDDKEYPLAYIVEDGNKKQLESALWWGECRRYNHGTGETEKFSPKFVTDDNSGFLLRILSAADDSSRGGKLSFWNCLMEKDGVESFVVGINADLLCDMIIETTLVNGKTNRDVFFARKRGQLGILHSDMSTYKDMIADDDRKKSLNKKKTTKWRIGYEYDTLNCSDVFLGWFSNPLSVEFDGYFSRHDTLNTFIDFLDKNHPVYDVYKGISKFDDMVVSCLSYNTHSDSCKCPYRQEGQKIFNVDNENSYYNMVADILIEDSSKNDSISEYDKYHRFFRVLRYAFRIFSHNHEATLKILSNLYDYYMNDCLAKHAEVVNSFYGIDTFNIEYLQGFEITQKYVVHSWEEYIKTLIEIVKMEISNNG